jgi:hypothetical protein
MNLMNYIICLLVFIISFSVSEAQILYDPQVLYDAPTGLFDLDSLRTVELNFYDASFHDSLVKGWYDESGIRMPATLKMGNVLLDSVAVRYKGNSTFFIAETNGIDKIPYNIDMNDYVSGQKLMGYKKIKLASALFDPTFVKEMTGYAIYRNYLPSPQANHMKLNVQGNYLGLYVNTEAIGSQFLKKHFGEKDGTLFKCDPSAQYGSGAAFKNSDLVYYGSDTSLYTERYQLKSDSLSAWFELLELIDVLSNDPANIDTILNVDRVLWYFALNQVLANTDTYNSLVRHNYYLYRTADGLFQIIPWDLSETFIGAMLDWLNDPDLIYQMDPYFGISQNGYPLVSSLLSNPLWYKQYTAHLRTVYKEQIADTSVVHDMAADAQALAYNAAQTDPWKFFTMAQFSDNLYNWFPWFTVKIAGIMKTVNERRAFLSVFPEMLKVPPLINSVHQSDSVPLAGDSVYISADISNATQVDLMLTISPHKSKFQAVAMLDDGTKGDLTAADGIYTALVPHNSVADVLSYYIRAQNNDAMSLSPARAEYEFYTYTVSPSVGISQVRDEKMMRIFPNPTNSTVLLEFDSGIIREVRVHDAAGKLLKVLVSVDDSSCSVDCQNLPAAVYMLQVDTDKGVFIRKLIVEP